MVVGSNSVLVLGQGGRGSRMGSWSIDTKSPSRPGCLGPPHSGGNDGESITVTIPKGPSSGRERGDDLRSGGGLEWQSRPGGSRDECRRRSLGPLGRTSLGSGRTGSKCHSGWRRARWREPERKWDLLPRPGTSCGVGKSGEGDVLFPRFDRESGPSPLELRGRTREVGEWK